MEKDNPFKIITHINGKPIKKPKTPREELDEWYQDELEALAEDYDNQLSKL